MSDVAGFRKHLLMDPKRLAELEEVYKGRLTENARLNKVAHLAAKQHTLLTSTKVPSGIKHELLKDIAPDVQYWTKAVRRPFLPGGGGGAGASDVADDGEGDDRAGEDFTQGPLQTLLTQLVPRPKKTPRRSPTPKKTTPLRPPVPPRPHKRLSGWDELAFADDPLMGDTATDKDSSLSKRLRRSATKAKVAGRPKKKKKTSEADKLKRPVGWLEFDTKLQRRLDGRDY